MAPIYMCPEQACVPLPAVVNAVIAKLERNKNRVEIGFAENLYCFCNYDYSAGLYWSFFGRLENDVLSIFLDSEDMDIIERFTEEEINLTHVFEKDFQKWHQELDIKEIDSCNTGMK